MIAVVVLDAACATDATMSIATIARTAMVTILIFMETPSNYGPRV
jgi:hypothetical protein